MGNDGSLLGESAVEPGASQECDLGVLVCKASV